MKEKNTNKIKVCFIILLVLSLMSFFEIAYCKKTSTYIDITQLQTNTPMQMMGYFIKTKNGKNIVVDGGNIGDSENLAKYILQNGNKVDYWFLTHFHTDHTGAFSDIIENYPDIQIENIICDFCSKEFVHEYEPSRDYQYDIISRALENDRINSKIINPNENQLFKIDNVKIKILNVYEDDITENLGNNTSMVFKMYVNNKSILFLGDAGVELSDKLLKNHYNDLKSDYVQVAHHGQNGATEELYKVVNPEFCFWPTPDWLWDNNNGGGYNSGEWKTLETRKWFDKLNIKENYIEKDGDITVNIK